MIMITYKDYQPEKTSRRREDIEWSIHYAYNAADAESPRVLLIGDSIVNAYQSVVRERLADKANVSFWASSKCVTDPNYFRELDFILDANRYALITFNNGLHSLTTPLPEWENAFCAAVDFIRAKLPDTKLCLTLSTALRDEALTVRVRALNEIAARAAEKRGLPVLDLFAQSCGFDRQADMTYTYPFRPHAIARQADRVAEDACRLLGLKSTGIRQLPTETGASGAMK